MRLAPSPRSSSASFDHVRSLRTPGVVECQVCRCDKSVEEAIVVWNESQVVLAVCHTCTREHDIVMRPSTTGSAGVDVLAKSRGGKPVPPRASAWAPRGQTLPPAMQAVAKRRIGPVSDGSAASLARAAS